jgi:hypothetical protein
MNTNHPSAKAIVRAQVAELTSHVSLIRELERSAVHGDSGAYRNYLSNVVSESLFGRSAAAASGAASPHRHHHHHHHTGSSAPQSPSSNQSIVNKTSRRTTPNRGYLHGAAVSEGFPSASSGRRNYTPLSAKFEESSVSLAGGHNKASTPRRNRSSVPPRGHSPTTLHIPKGHRLGSSPYRPHNTAQSGTPPPAATYEAPRFAPSTRADRDDALIENVWGYLNKVRH